MSAKGCELKRELARPGVSGPKTWLSDDGSGEDGSRPYFSPQSWVAQELVKSGDDLTNELVDKRSRRSISRKAVTSMPSRLVAISLDSNVSLSERPGI
jgi:hypothetical protein